MHVTSVTELCTLALAHLADAPSGYDVRAFFGSLRATKSVTASCSEFIVGWLVAQGLASADQQNRTGWVGSATAKVGPALGHRKDDAILWGYRNGHL